MAKKGQHKNDARDQRKSPGPNNPSKSVTITTGTYKKKETAEAQRGPRTYGPAKAQREWNPDSREGPGAGHAPGAQGRPGRAGRGPGQLPRRFAGPETAPRRPRSREPRGPMLPGAQHPEEWRQDLNPHALDGQNRGPATDEAQKGCAPVRAEGAAPPRSGLSDADLKQVPVLEREMRLQQGRLLDLNDPRRGEFTATGDMVAGAESSTSLRRGRLRPLDRLTGVEEPERLPGR